MNKNIRIIFFLIALGNLCSFPIKGQKSIGGADTLRNVRLREVIVTATLPDKPVTSSLIRQDAIRHVQATDLSDLLQLLPGVLTRNPNLNAPAVLTIRSSTYDNSTNALGTALLVDGLRMSNNMNMQQIGLAGPASLFNSSVLSGFDVRSLSPASIESVEVIRGVPSARYGDATSGVVLVNSKAGLEPYTMQLRFTATEKMIAAGKGWALGTRGGILHLGADYTLSAQDPRSPEQTFQRTGIQMAHAKDFSAASLRFNFRGYWIRDKGERANNTMEGEFEKASDRGFSFSANGRWNPNKSWISNVEYKAGLTYSCRKNESSTYYSGTQQVTTYTRIPGEQPGLFLAPGYFDRLSVEGKPLYAEVSIMAHLQNSLFNNVYSHFLAGMETSMEGNRGKGIRFDPLRPPLEMVNVRTRSFQTIPFVYRYAAFAEDQITLQTGKMRTELQAGIRIAQLHTEAFRTPLVADPRINVRQVLIDRKENSNLRHFSVRAGWGVMHKMPVLAYLYPDKAYTDQICFTYNDRENGERLTVMHTFVSDHTFNPRLRLPLNRKIEIGMNLRARQITADVVWFCERLRNGFCTTRRAEPFTYRQYEPLMEKGEKPQWTGSGIVNSATSLSYATRATFATYLFPENGIEQFKQGIEYILDMGYWNLFHTSLLVSGSYLKVREKNTALSVLHPQMEVNGKPYPYAGIYETDVFASNFRIWQLFSSRFQCITQFPRIGLVTSLTVQAVWLEKQRRGMESNYNNPVYLVDPKGNRVEGDPMTDILLRKRLDPLYYIDSNGVRHPFTPDLANDKRFADLVLEAGSPALFQTDSSRPYFLMNLRVTKEMGRHVSVAFCANNITRSNPKRYTPSTGQYTIKNPDLYYGAELTIRF